MIDFSNIGAISFDCYGTLIDWQTGILRAVGPVLERRGVSMSDEEIIEGFSRAEREAERGAWVSYREVQRRVMGELLGKSGRVGEGESGNGDADLDVLWKSIREWPAFADTGAALRELQKRWKVAVVSNIDDDLFEGTRPKLGVELDELVTAEQVRSYKPGRAHFEELLKRLGMRSSQVLHVAESRWHDVEPAGAMGFRTVWVDRVGAARALAPSASGPGVGVPDATVGSLAELVRLVAGG